MNSPDFLAIGGCGAPRATQKGLCRLSALVLAELFGWFAAAVGMAQGIVRHIAILAQVGFSFGVHTGIVAQVLWPWLTWSAWGLVSA